MVSIFLPDRASANVYHYLIYVLSNLQHIQYTPDTNVIEMMPGDYDSDLKLKDINEFKKYILSLEK